MEVNDVTAERSEPQFDNGCTRLPEQQNSNTQTLSHKFFDRLARARQFAQVESHSKSKQPIVESKQPEVENFSDRLARARQFAQVESHSKLKQPIVESHQSDGENCVDLNQVELESVSSLCVEQSIESVQLESDVYRVGNSGLSLINHLYKFDILY